MSIPTSSFLRELRDDSTAGLVSIIEALGQKRMLAPMIGSLSVEPLAAAEFGNCPGQMPWEIATHFDGSGYQLETTKRGVTMTGGPRARKFAYGSNW
jgi:hypothetical protein